MSATTRTVLEVPACRSPQAGLFLAALDDQRGHLIRDTRGLAPAELERQFAPGMNTIGMLLAHVAVAETHILHVGVLGRPDSDVRGVIGVTMDDDGMPLVPDAPPSPALTAKDLAFFDDLLARSRAHTRDTLATLEDADLDRQVIRHRPDGGTRVLNVRWALYHLVEHEAGHRGQINLLRHLYRTRPAG
ncbi:MAG TPA: DinB family protein [Candidatus Limnocylindria bacterium]|nr:DinB family protein [Candidatus Limnocylindria bacterium]